MIWNENMKNSKLIWDIPTRIFHWSLVLAIFALWYTSDSELGLIETHMNIGYFVMFLIVYRVVWGFIGSYHSRFKHFPLSPKSITSYLHHTKESNGKSYVGHNPVGSLMIVFMLALLALQVTSGLFISDDIFSAGPYNSVVEKDLEAIFRFIHGNGFDVLLIAILFHVSGVFYYEFVKKIPLIWAMFNGKKQVEVQVSQLSKFSLCLRAIILVLLAAAFVYWLVVLNAPIIEEYYY